jgi:serine/threonine protein kinase
MLHLKSSRTFLVSYFACPLFMHSWSLFSLYGINKDDERVDAWSIGVVTFVLLVGYPPFLEDNQSVLFEKIRTGEWEFVENDWRRISVDAKEFVRGLLTTDPKERWSIRECLRSNWIRKDPDNLSSIDLSTSIATMRQRRRRLRTLAKTMQWVGRAVKEVPTKADDITE